MKDRLSVSLGPSDAVILGAPCGGINVAWTTRSRRDGRTRRVSYIVRTIYSYTRFGYVQHYSWPTQASDHLALPQGLRTFELSSRGLFDWKLLSAVSRGNYSGREPPPPPPPALLFPSFWHKSFITLARRIFLYLSHGTLSITIISLPRNNFVFLQGSSGAKRNERDYFSLLKKCKFNVPVGKALYGKTAALNLM